MAAILLQPAGTALRQIHPVPSCGNSHQRSLAPQQHLLGNSNVVRGSSSSSIPAIPAGLGQKELDEVSCSVSSIGAQELLWRQYFLDPARWWDHRKQKKSSRSPDFRHKESKDVLWLNNFRKPAWVDKQLAALDAQLGPPMSNSTLLNDFGPRRVAGYEIDATAIAVSNLCEKGQLSEAVDALGVLVQKEARISTSLFYSVLKSCVGQKNLVLGQRVHELIVKVGYESNTFLANHVLRMYASHGRLEEVKDVFTKVANPDAFTWSAVVAAHTKHGEPKQAIKLYQKMRSSSVGPDGHVFVAALQACASAEDLESGQQVHADLLKSGIELNLFVWNILVDMYAKCGRLEDARTIFDSLVTRNVVTWNAMIAGYAEHGQAQEAIALYEQMDAEGVVLADPVTFACSLKACAKVGALQQGKQIRAQIVERGLEFDTVVSTCLVDMYAKCGRLEDARKVFESLPVKDVVTWNAMIAGYAEQGLGQDALALYALMEQKSVIVADAVTFACVLKACATVGAIEQGEHFHSQIMERGLEANTFVGTSLVDMYAKCGRLEDARRVFDSLVTRNVVTWNAMLAGYAEDGRGQEALAVYERMEQEGLVVPDAVTFACLLKACGRVGAIEQGRQFHSQIVQRGLDSNVVVGTCLVDMYVKCGRLEEAHMVFEGLSTKDVVTWTAMIAGYAEQGLGLEALALYGRMEQQGLILANSYTFACLLKACATVGAFSQGKQLHSQILERGLESDAVVGACLVDMYVKCGKVDDARRVFDSLGTREVVTCNTMIAGYAKCGKLEDASRLFDSLTTRDVVTWNAMIAGYAEHGFGQEALALYARMEEEDRMLADPVTYACLLKACARASALQQGKQLHAQILRRGLEGDTLLGTCLVDMYSKCGSLDEARKVFDNLVMPDVVAWNAMIAGYAQHGLGREALALYARMEQEGVIVADTVTFACLLKACAVVGALQQGKQLHAQILERGLDAHTYVGTCLIDMYAKCGRVEEASKVFESLATTEVVTWNAMIAAYAEHELGQEALALYARMQQEGLMLADPVTYACLLKACASAAALQQGKQLHSQILERGLEADTAVGNGLVHMYTKCGKLEEARRVFDSLPTRNVVTWNAMINGYGQSNEGHKAIECFQEMVRHGVEADGTTFTCLLVACSHEGLVKEGRQFFKAMVDECGIRPTVEHYTCMVDLLGRAGHLDEAEEMLLSFESDAVGFTSLLNACRSHGDVERGVRCFEGLTKLDPQNPAAYVMMGNIYADAGRWSNVDMTERLRKSAGARKKPALAGIEVGRHVHTFVVGEEKKGDISSKVRSMSARLKVEGGHVPHTELVLKPVCETVKEDELCGHAEKLALAYGLLNTPDGTPLLVTKNMRMCSDCHSSTEIMSRVEKREIVVRDAHRVHRFVDGSCLCGGRP